MSTPFSSTRPGIRARLLPRFPANVLGTNGVTVTKSGLTYTFSLTTFPGFPPSPGASSLGDANNAWNSLFLSAGSKIEWDSLSPGKSSVTHVVGGTLLLDAPLGFTVRTNGAAGNAFAVGRQGAVLPAFKVNVPANGTTGVEIRSETDPNVYITATSQGAAAQLLLDGKGGAAGGVYLNLINNGPTYLGSGLHLESGGGPERGQIFFPATQNPSGNANALDDYEKGTFSPILFFGAGADAAYTSQLGRYIKVGRCVFGKVTVTITNNGTATGNASIAGLPYPSANNGVFTPCTGSLNLGASAGALTPFINPNSSSVTLSDKNFTFLNDTTIPNACTLLLEFFYEAVS